MITLLLFSLTLIGTGAAGSFYNIFSSEFAFLLAASGIVLLGSTFFINLILIFRGSRFRSWLVFLFGIPAVASLGFYGYQLQISPMNDVTTNLQFPPKFEFPVFSFPVAKGGDFLDPSLRLNRDYKTAFSATQLRLYPDTKGLKIKAPGPETYKTILKVIQEQLPSWKILLDDPQKLRVEYIVERLPIRITHDVVIEVRYDNRMPNDSEVEIRARSRIEYGDFGLSLMYVDDLLLRLGLALKPLEQEVAHQLALAEARGTFTSTSTSASTSTSTSILTSTATSASLSPSSNSGTNTALATKSQTSGTRTATGIITASSTNSRTSSATATAAETVRKASIPDAQLTNRSPPPSPPAAKGQKK